MTGLDLVRFEQLLRAAEAEAARILAHRSGLEVEPSPDPSDEAQYSAERELTARSLTQESRLLAAVDWPWNESLIARTGFVSTATKRSA